MRIAKFYSREVLVNEVYGIVNSNKFTRNYDDLYLGVKLFGTCYICSVLSGGFIWLLPV